MTAPTSEPMSGKTRRRSTVKAAKTQAADKVKATIHLTLEASQRLTVHAAMLGLDRSTLVEQLIRDNLKRFVVSDRGGQTDSPDAQPAVS